MKRKRNQYIILVAAIGFLVLLPWLFNSPEQQVLDNQGLFTSNFEMPEASITRGADTEDVWERGNVYYVNKEYDQAIESFENILQDTTFNRTSQVYVLLGACFIAQGDMEKGIEALGNIDEDSYEIERATWYRGLAFLNLDNISAAREHFVKLTQDEKGEYYDSANKLLKQLQ